MLHRLPQVENKEETSQASLEDFKSETASNELWEKVAKSQPDRREVNSGMSPK